MIHPTALMFAQIRNHLVPMIPRAAWLAIALPSGLLAAEAFELPAYQFPPEPVTVANAAHWQWMRTFYEREISRPAGTGPRPVLAPQGVRQTCDKRRRTLVGQTGGVPARRVPVARRHGVHLPFFEQTG